MATPTRGALIVWGVAGATVAALGAFAVYQWRAQAHERTGVVLSVSGACQVLTAEYPAPDGTIRTLAVVSGWRSERLYYPPGALVSVGAGASPPCAASNRVSCTIQPGDDFVPVTQSGDVSVVCRVRLPP